MPDIRCLRGWGVGAPDRATGAARIGFESWPGWRSIRLPRRRSLPFPPMIGLCRHDSTAYWHFLFVFDSALLFNPSCFVWIWMSC